MYLYSEQELHTKVDAALRRIRTVLENNRNPQYPADVPHRYEDASTVAPQALMLLNNDFVQVQATELAKRLLREADSETQRLNRAYQLLFARPARKEEVAIARELLAKSGQPETEAAWRDLAHVLLCSNEFIYVD